MLPVLLLAIISMVASVSIVPELEGVTNYQLVRPIRLHTVQRRDAESARPEAMKYAMKVDGKDIEMHLEKNRELLGADYSETYYRKDNTPVTTTPTDIDHCYYHGKIMNESESTVSISLVDSFVSCASSAGNMSLFRCQLFEAGFHPEVLHLEDSSCKGTLQDGMLVFHFNNNAEQCGTVLTSNGTYVKYENVIQNEVDRHDDSPISRKRSIRLHFSCEYPLTQSVSMEVGINLIQSIVSRRLPSGIGSYQVSMIPFLDAGYRFPYTGKEGVEIGQRMYIEVGSKGIDKPQIATVLDSCWATPVNRADYPVRWELLVRECPNEKDTTVELDGNGVSSVAHFSFKLFTFTNYSTIFLHCQIHLCVQATQDCAAHCYPGYHQRRRRELSYDIAGISVGPLTWTMQSEAARPVRSVLGSGTPSLQVSHSTSLHKFSSLLILLTLLTVAALS